MSESLGVIEVLTLLEARRPLTFEVANAERICEVWRAVSGEMHLLLWRLMVLFELESILRRRSLVPSLTPAVVATED